MTQIVLEGDMPDCCQRSARDAEDCFECPSCGAPWTAVRPDRERLKDLCRSIFEEACRRIDDPKNVAKGDHWRELEWRELGQFHVEELIEFTVAVEQGRGDPIWEAADVLAVLAMQVDKADVRKAGAE